MVALKEVISEEQADQAYNKAVRNCHYRKGSCVVHPAIGECEQVAEQAQWKTQAHHTLGQVVALMGELESGSSITQRWVSLWRRLEQALEADPDEGLELKPEVVERLKRSLDTPPESLLAPGEMRRRLVDKFIAELRQLDTTIAKAVLEVVTTRSTPCPGYDIIQEWGDMATGWGHVHRECPELLRRKGHRPDVISRCPCFAGMLPHNYNPLLLCSRCENDLHSKQCIVCRGEEVVQLGYPESWDEKCPICFNEGVTKSTAKDFSVGEGALVLPLGLALRATHIEANEHGAVWTVRYVGFLPTSATGYWDVQGSSEGVDQAAMQAVLDAARSS